jgi:uncharacterized membrane protein YkvA (DUF1232 family)
MAAKRRKRSSKKGSKNGSEEAPQSGAFGRRYSDAGFWNKVKRYARVAGREVLEPALKMYYAAKDPKTPTWAKTTIYSALGYLIVPMDALPDALPVVGFADDLGALTAALAVVAAHVKPRHAKAAKEQLAKWFD